MPQLNPEEAGKQALAEYDRNNDGTLDAKELEQCPGLKSGLKGIDTDKDGRLSATEIANRLSAFQASRLGLMAIPCQVSLDGSPLAGARVELVPEKFLGTAIKSAVGISDERGQVSFRVEGQDLAGVQCGFYHVVISKKNAGKEMLPAKYNAKTTLGQEVGPDLQGGLRFILTSQ